MLNFSTSLTGMSHLISWDLGHRKKDLMALLSETIQKCDGCKGSWKNGNGETLLEIQDSSGTNTPFWPFVWVSKIHL